MPNIPSPNISGLMEPEKISEVKLKSLMEKLIRLKIFHGGLMMVLHANKPQPTIPKFG